jgi:hypothetical protein
LGKPYLEMHFELAQHTLQLSSCVTQLLFHTEEIKTQRVGYKEHSEISTSKISKILHGRQRHTIIYMIDKFIAMNKDIITF